MVGERRPTGDPPETSAEAGVDRLVHISSAAVQGRGPLDETGRREPFSAYSRSKAEAERFLVDRVGDGPPHLVIYRPTSVMGPGRITTQRLRQRCARRVPVVSGGTRLPLAHIDNVGDAAVFLATVDDPPRIAVHPSEDVTVADVVRWSEGTAHRIPGVVARAGLTAGRGAALARPSLTAPVRRLEIFLAGQEVEASAMADRGWVPPVPKEGYAQLFSPAPASRPSVSGPGPLRIAVYAGAIGRPLRSLTGAEATSG